MLSGQSGSDGNSSVIVLFVFGDISIKLSCYKLHLPSELNLIIKIHAHILLEALMASLPGAVVLAEGPLAGEMGPEPDRDCWDWVEPAGETTGEGEGPLLWLGRWGEAWGEKGDCPWLLAPPCSPWLLLLLLLEEPPPPPLTAEPRPASVPVGRSSIEPDRSWNRRKDLQWVCLKLIQAFDEKWHASGGKFKHELKQRQNSPGKYNVMINQCYCNYFSTVEMGLFGWNEVV